MLTGTYSISAPILAQIPPDFIPGVVMFFLFSQLQLLALPIKSYAGSSYPEPELMVWLLIWLQEMYV